MAVISLLTTKILQAPKSELELAAQLRGNSRNSRQARKLLRLRELCSNATHMPADIYLESVVSITNGHLLVNLQWVCEWFKSNGVLQTTFKCGYGVLLISFKCVYGVLLISFKCVYGVLLISFKCVYGVLLISFKCVYGVLLLNSF